jgi:hypothetical protein
MRIFLAASFTIVLVTLGSAQEAPRTTTGTLRAPRHSEPEAVTIPPPPVFGWGESVEEFCTLFADWQSRTDAPTAPSEAKMTCAAAPKVSERWTRERYRSMQSR